MYLLANAALGGCRVKHACVRAGPCSAGSKRALADHRIASQPAAAHVEMRGFHSSHGSHGFHGCSSWPIPVDIHSALGHQLHPAGTMAQNPLFVRRIAANTKPDALHARIALVISRASCLIEKWHSVVAHPLCLACRVEEIVFSASFNHTIHPIIVRMIVMIAWREKAIQSIDCHPRQEDQFGR